MKKSLISSIITLLVITILGGTVNAASASVSPSSKTIEVGDNITITVSIGQKVSAARFTLNFDSNKLEYISKSGGGTFNKANGKYFEQSDDGVEETISSVSFTFKAKQTGSTNVSISNLQISKGDKIGISSSVGNSASITINEKTVNTGNNGNTGNTSKPTKNKKPTSSTNKVNNTEENVVEEQVEPAPNELIRIDQEGVITIKNEETGVMIKGLPNAIDENIVLKVENIKENSELYNKLMLIIKDIHGNKKYFNIQLLKDDEEIQPNGFVTVFLPIPEEYDKDLVELYYIDEQNETYEQIKGEIQENYYTFTTNSFSTYALVERVEEQKVVEQTEINENKVMDILNSIAQFFSDVIVLWVVIGILILIIIVQSIIIKRNK